ncbi:unnamed protein product [Brassica oleracea]
MKLLATALFSVTFGILIGLSFPSLWITKIFLHLLPFCIVQASLPKTLLCSVALSQIDSDTAAPTLAIDNSKACFIYGFLQILKALRDCHRDLKNKPRYLVTFTVGYNQRHNIDACIKKFSDSFTIVLFHYDGRVSEWDDEFEWSKNVIHISVLKQTKWWYAKRFLHPDIIAR